ncbi:nitroreductase/quinone reductase family protein [Jiangella alkaliphila]|uniref:nitroreductase/quinone reductase family protein n=1 Tax=Jiangella alkaliphila TaxID=419479 RepID=UPI0022770E7E|nr:nitroreductase/quinone reductase family protein [Jiangella alkaliphila]
MVDEFRTNRGRVGGPFEGARLLLLTTTGARSGAPHTVPVGYLPDDGERLIVIGSAGGAARHPAWFHNLVAHPRVHVEDGLFAYDADAVVLDGAEREAVFARAVEADPGWADYERGSGRRLPVVALTPVPGPPGGPGIDSPAAFLTTVHESFRRELALVRAEVAAAGPRLGAQLRLNCLSACHGLHFHHTAEDTHLFPGLAASNPELAPVLERLRAEHEVVAALLARLEAAVRSDDDGDSAAVLADVDALIEQLEAHLDWEEQQLVPVLSAPL